MTLFYELLFRALQWHQGQVERVLFWLWVRLTDHDEYEVDVYVCRKRDEADPPHNVVHLPRRGVH